MSIGWLYDVTRTGKLSVFNSADTWSTTVEQAITTFNGLCFPVRLDRASDEKAANVVVRRAIGPDSYTFDSKDYQSIALATGADWKPEYPHGLTVAAFSQYNEMLFAVIFLPGKLSEPTEGLKLAVVVHELIHACGMISKNSNKERAKIESHDREGIMYDIMVAQGDGVIEGSKPKGKKPMPPIRVGLKTRNELQSAWGNVKCEDPKVTKKK